MKKFYTVKEHQASRWLTQGRFATPWRHRSLEAPLQCKRFSPQNI